jgi:hypothetical protein
MRRAVSRVSNLAEREVPPQVHGCSGEVVIATVAVGCKCFPREKLLSRYGARRIATNIAKLPDLLRKLR